MGEDLTYIDLSCTIHFDPESGCYVAFCSKLDLYTAGRTEKIATQSMVDAIDMWMKHYEKHGLLKNKLFERGAIERSVRVAVDGEANCVARSAELIAV